MLCVEGRPEPKTCGKSKLQADSNSIYFVVCCTLTFPYPQRDWKWDNEHFQNISSVHAFPSLTVMIMIYDQKYENGSSGRQNWCNMESDRGKVLKAKLYGSLLHPPNQCWLFRCLLQVTRAGLKFPTKVVEDKRLWSANFLLFLFLWRLLMGNYFGRNHWVPTTPDTFHTIQLTLKSLSKGYLINS